MTNEKLESLTVNGREIALAYVKHRRARRYVLRLRSDATARVTIPRGGSATEGRRFAERHQGWLERQLQRLAERPRRQLEWVIGTEILFRGAQVKLESAGDADNGLIRCGCEMIRVTDVAADLRLAIERHLWKLAARELTPRVLELAALHQAPVRRISIRNQKSRWGSCSRRGTISLNWRLIQSPAFVRDYLILHELSHLKEMNHSERFWREVERVCPDYRAAERWLKQNSGLLR